MRTIEKLELLNKCDFLVSEFSDIRYNISEQDDNTLLLIDCDDCGNVIEISPDMPIQVLDDGLLWINGIEFSAYSVHKVTF